MPKFKIGDVVIRNNESPNVNYCFNDMDICRPGDTVIISAVGDNLYSVEGAYITTPNWYGMEENFDLYQILNWKQRFENEIQIQKRR